MITLLNVLESRTAKIEGELITNKWETNYSFIWDSNDTTLTEEGKEYFKKILNSPVTIQGANLVLLDSSITYDELELFTGAVAGYCSVKNYERWFNNKWTQSL